MKKFLSLSLAVIMMFSMAVSVFAAENENIDAVLDRRIKVTYNGELQTFTDANGKIVYPIVYQGTTYLPVRAASALVKLPVQWDGANYTVVLGGDGAPYEAAAPVGTPLTESENIKTVLDKNIKVTFNGELQTFTDVNGKVVYPIVHEGTTYLPVRAVSNLVNLPVEWDGANYTVVLGEKAEQPVTPPAKNELHRGTWNGNIYTNEFANIKCTVDANHTIATDEQIIESMGTPSNEVIYDALIQDNSTLTSTIISFIDFSTSENSEEVTPEMYASALLQEFSDSGENVTSLGSGNISLYDDEYHYIKLLIDNVLYNNYYIKKIDNNYIACIIILANSTENADKALTHFGYTMPSTEKSEVDMLSLRGAWNDDIYTNNFANIKFTLDKASVAYTDNEIALLFDSVYKADRGELYDMMVENFSDGTVTMILLEDLSVKTDSAGKVTAEIYANKLANDLSDDYTVVGKENVKLGSNNYVLLKTKVSGLFQNYYVMKVGNNHIVTLIITGKAEKGVNAAAACFN